MPLSPATARTADPPAHPPAPAVPAGPSVVAPPPATLRTALAQRWARALARVPGLCEVCRQVTAGRLCQACVARHAAARARCLRCGVGLGLPAAACGRCLRDPPPFVRTVCAVDYAFPWDRLVSAFKFHGQPELSTALARLLAAAVRRQAGTVDQATPLDVEPGAVTLVLPVPLSTARLRERGYNQAWELARRVGAACGVRARADVLLRALDTPHQTGLDRAARERNLRAAFFVEPRHRAAVEGRRVALVDDVMTSTATARESASALRRAGAAAVEIWVFARTPEPS